VKLNCDRVCELGLDNIVVLCVSRKQLVRLDLLLGSLLLHLMV
jgi:hypothetical protein